MLIRDVVGEFEFVERDNFLHPGLASGGTVRVDVHSLRHLRVRLPGHHPPAGTKKEKHVTSILSTKSMKKKSFSLLRHNYLQLTGYRIRAGV